MPDAPLQSSDPPERTICVCVDDYGLHAGINQAALNLARDNRISAVSCLVDGPAWHAGWDALKADAAQLEIGLHLNFTEDLGQNRIMHPLPRLILLAYLHGLNRAALKRDIQRQFERFESVTGHMPDFVDGHQHVHQLPVIRDALLEVLNKRYGARKPWLRATRPPERWSSARLPLSVKFKAGMIASLGASSLSRLARTHGYSQNRHLLGVYGFDMSATRYLRQMRIWLKHAEEGDVLMCHPSLSGPWNDPLLDARLHEYQVLSGDAFAALAAWAGIKIGTLPLATTGLADTVIQTRA